MAKSNLTRGIPSRQTYEITTVPPCSFTNFAKTEVVFLGHHLGFSRPGGTGPNICSEPDVLRRGSTGDRLVSTQEVWSREPVWRARAVDSWDLDGPRKKVDLYHGDPLGVT